jgi:acyl homoserine lactone synthase
MEFDEYDNGNTRYILGMYKNQIFCSVRFTLLSQPNMITHTFQECFNSIELPENGIESSRFFVDKERARMLLGENYPTSQLLFISMVSWAIKNRYNAIHTIVSRPMLSILKRSGWRLTVLKEAFLSERERIYLVSLPVSIEDKLLLSAKLSENIKNTVPNAVTWPLWLPI